MNRITEWNSTNYQGGDGILIATDMNQEWMLKWWWNHYSKHNDSPVTFCDIGMSNSARKWCASKGNVISFSLQELSISQKENIPPHVQKEWESIHSERIWDCRLQCLQKPFFILQSPYDRTIFVDTDCKVNNSLTPLFSLCNADDGISMVQMELSKATIVHSGVIVARRNAPAFSNWAQTILENHQTISCDEQGLILAQQKTPFKINPLPIEYNFINYWKTDSPMQVNHYSGVHGKREILKQIV